MRSNLTKTAPFWFGFLGLYVGMHATTGMAQRAGGATAGAQPTTKAAATGANGVQNSATGQNVTGQNATGVTGLPARK